MLDAIMLLVDTAIIGRLGTAPLGAVGLSTLIFVFSNLFFNFLTVCTTSTVAIAAADKDTGEVSKATARGMFVGLICGTALIFALWTYSPLLMTLLGTTPETATLAVMYLRVRCFACPAFLLYNVGTGNFRGRKDTRTPLLAYMANNITYVLLELLFVFGLNWGVMGAALAPAIGQYVGLAVMVWLLVREKALFVGDLGHVPTLQEVTPLLQKGLPLGAVNLLVLPVVVGCTSLVTALGVTALAAHTIIKQVWDFWTQVSQCLNIAANSMVASALGEKDLSTARDVLLRILLMGFAPGVVLGAMFLVAQSAIPAVFTQDPGVISAVTHIVPLLALAMPLIPMATVLEGALLGAVDTSYIAKRTGLGIAIALAVIYGSQSVLHMGLLGIWAGLASFLFSNTVCDTLRLMSPGSPLPVAIVPGISDPPLNGDDLE
jgi:putative MATE family efflux protein